MLQDFGHRGFLRQSLHWSVSNFKTVMIMQLSLHLPLAFCFNVIYLLILKLYIIKMTLNNNIAVCMCLILQLIEMDDLIQVIDCYYGNFVDKLFYWWFSTEMKWCLNDWFWLILINYWCYYTEVTATVFSLIWISVCLSSSFGRY